MHNFLKVSIGKLVSDILVWDEVKYIARASNNFVQNKHSKERAFFLMFGKDTYTPLMQLNNPKIRYIGDKQILLVLDVIRDMYMLAIHNIKLSRERQENSLLPIQYHSFKLVLRYLYEIIPEIYGIQSVILLTEL